MTGLDATHDPARQSWVASANDPETDFPIQNLPFGVFSVAGGARRIGVAIGAEILDLTALERAGRLRPSSSGPVFDGDTLNPFMALPSGVWSGVRACIGELLDSRGGDPTLPLVPQASAAMHLPIFVRGFTDFYASREHATNVGTMFRDPDNALLPNWLHIPIGYNGRASTVVVSGTDIIRPLGQVKAPQEARPRLGPTAKLDVEVELGAIVGTSNAIGTPLSTSEAQNSIFGYVLLNDWSARDIQVWEYQPLGPFQSKAFGTTISPWVVTRAALEPYLVPTPPRLTPLLPYLQEASNTNLDLSLTLELTPQGGRSTVISQTNARHLYYSSAQQLTQHTISGCAMQTGDLLGSGTISGPTRNSCGSLLELTWNGRDPVAIDGGSRTFLLDGDTATIRGWCGPDQEAGRPRAARIGFGACRGTIRPAPQMPG